MTQAEVPDQPLQKLPVIPVVQEAYGLFFRYLRYLPQAVLLPVLLAVPLYWVYLQRMKQVLVDPAGVSGQGLVLTAINLGFLLIFLLFYVSWYRLCLLGPEAGRPPLFPLPNRRYWRFLGYTFLMAVVCIVITVLGTLPIIVVGVIAGGLTGMSGSQPEVPVLAGVLMALCGLLLLVLIIFVMLRLSFIFPATAVDEDYTARNSWSHTKGQALRLFATLLMTCLPIYLVMLAVNFAVAPSLFGPIDQQPFQDPVQVIEEIESQLVAAMLFGFPLGLAFTALFVGTVAAAFRAVTGWYPAPPGAPEAQGD